MKISKSNISDIIDKFNNSKNKKIIRFINIFDYNSNIKIDSDENSNEGKNLLNLFEKNCIADEQIQKLVKDISNLSDYEFETLKEYIIKTDGNLPHWFKDTYLTKINENQDDLVISKNKKNKIYVDVEFRDFDKDIYRQREISQHVNNIKNKLLSDADNKLVTEKIKRKNDYLDEEEFVHKIINYKNNKPIYLIGTNAEGKIIKTEEFKTDSTIVTKYNLNGELVQVFNNDKSKKISEKKYVNKKLKNETLYNTAGKITESNCYEGDKIINKTTYVYNDDNSYTKSEKHFIDDETINLAKKYNIQLSDYEETDYGADDKKLKLRKYFEDKLQEENFFDENATWLSRDVYKNGELLWTEKLDSETGLFVKYDKQGNKIVEQDVKTSKTKGNSPEEKSISELQDSIATDETPTNQSLIENIKVEELHNMSEYNKIAQIFNIQNQIERNAEFDKLIKLLKSPGTEKVLAGDYYEKYKNIVPNGIKIMCNLIERFKSGNLTFREMRTIKENFLGMLSSSNNYIKNSFVDKPDGVVTKPRYQYSEGDCWFLETVNGLSRHPKGKKLLKRILKPYKNGDIVKFEGGKLSYKISMQDIIEAPSLSNGEGDVRALEIAMDRYRRDNEKMVKSPDRVIIDDSDGKFDYSRINGGHSDEALEAFTGNKTLIAKIENGVLGVEKDGKFIKITKDNMHKLKEIPIIIPATMENLAMLSKLKDDVVVFFSSAGHQYSIEFNDDNKLNVHEPWNSENSPSFTYSEIIHNAESRGSATPFNKELSIMFL